MASRLNHVVRSNTAKAACLSCSCTACCRCRAQAETCFAAAAQLLLLKEHVLQASLSDVKQHSLGHAC